MSLHAVSKTCRRKCRRLFDYIQFMISRAKAHGVDAIVCPAGFEEKGRGLAGDLGVDLVRVDALDQAVDYARSVQSLDSFLESLKR